MADTAPQMAEIELEITDLARGGAGVARGPDGRVVFVPFTAPGDLVRVMITEQNRRYSQAEVVEVLRPSPQRQSPPCAVFSICGGCTWQHLPYALQWQTKAGGVLHALDRVGVARPTQFREIPATQIWEYRNRIQLRGQGDRIGFYARRSNDLVPIQRCEIARPELNAQIDRLREQGAKLPRPYKAEVEVLENGEIREAWNASHASGGFRQVHDEQNQRLRDWVADQISASRWVLDLFGGDGNLSRGLRERVSAVDCVDFSVPSAPPEANYRFHRSKVLSWLLREVQKPTRERSGPGIAILDPPREGLGGDGVAIMAALEQLGVREALAIGCDPDAWAHDVSRWIKRGWRLREAGVLDFFPQTPHIESLAVLVREN